MRSTPSFVLSVFFFFLGFSSSILAKETCEGQLAENPARLFAKSVMATASSVSIQKERIAQVAKLLAASQFKMNLPGWNFPPHPTGELPLRQLVTYYLALDAINFRYFDAEGRTFSDVNSKAIGAGLLTERFTSNLDLFLPGKLSTVRRAETDKKLFFGTVPIPEPSTRTAYLRDVGKFMEALRHQDIWKWLDSFTDGVSLAQAIAEQLPAYAGDPFLKRSQLFVGMMAGRLQTTELPSGLRNTERMTIYADYILPMVLHQMGVLNYNTGLLALVRNRKHIPSGSADELEIRAATILACDALLRELRSYPGYENVSILALDTALWLQGGEIPNLHASLVFPPGVYVRERLPHHRTENTLAY